MNNVLGTRLKELRIKNEKLQRDVADYLNITTSAYGYYEKGIRQPNPEMLSKLAEYFNVTTDYLLGRPDKPSEKKYKHLDNTLIGRVSTKIEKMDDDELELLDKLVDKLMKDDK